MNGCIDSAGDPKARALSCGWLVSMQCKCRSPTLFTGLALSIDDSLTGFSIFRYHIQLSRPSVTGQLQSIDKPIFQ